MSKDFSNVTFESMDISDHLEDFYRRRRDEVAARWKRYLPFGDYVSDRWERAKTMGFGDRTSIYDSALVPGTVSVGSDGWIGPFTLLDGSGGLEIGDFCSISAGVQIYTHDSVQWAVSNGVAPFEYGFVKIGSRCYIGPNSIIAKGVTIGEDEEYVVYEPL
jgi:acetyltransferase-like isoleucine patch superfamily enzyme